MLFIGLIVYWLAFCYLNFALLCLSKHFVNSVFKGAIYTTLSLLLSLYTLHAWFQVKKMLFINLDNLLGCNHNIFELCRRNNAGNYINLILSV